MTNWADSLRDLCSSKRFNDQVWNYDFYIFLFAQTYEYRKAWGYICYTLIVVQSKPAANWNVVMQFTSDTNFSKVTEKKKDYLGWSISGVTKRVHKAPYPLPSKSIINKSNTLFFIIIFRSGNYKTVEVRKLKNFNEVEFLRNLQMNDWNLDTACDNSNDMGTFGNC